MRSKLIAALLVTCGMLAGAQTLFAHHSGTMFDETTTAELTGTIKEFQFTNPHSWIHIDVRDADGKVTRWMVEGGSPNALFRRGVNKDALPQGTEILVDGYQAKDGSNRANGRDITFPDGKKIFLGSSGDQGPPEDSKK